MKSIEELNISPWPWKVRHENHGSFVTSDGGSQSVAFCAEESCFKDGKVTRTPRKRNARLISAAPEMYECLREAVNESCKMCYSYKFDDQCHLSKHDSCFIQRWRAALAKAAGEEANRGA